MIIADTSGLLAYFNQAEPSHRRVRSVIDGEDEEIVVSPYVVAELDYLVMTRLGVDAELTVLDELSGGAYELASMSVAGVQKASSVIQTYRDQAIGLADASIVVLAETYRTRRVLTLDRRHFDVLRPVGGGHFDVLP